MSEGTFLVGCGDVYVLPRAFILWRFVGREIHLDVSTIDIEIIDVLPAGSQTLCLGHEDVDGDPFYVHVRLLSSLGYGWIQQRTKERRVG